MPIEASNVLVNGNFADWKHPDGTVTKLPAYYSTVSRRQTYIIRGFHQIHCWVSILCFKPSPFNAHLG